MHAEMSCDCMGSIAAYMQIARLVKAQDCLMANDRRALLDEQQASMERLVSIISSSVHRDLPLRMEEIVKAEVCLRAASTCQLLCIVMKCWREMVCKCYLLLLSSKNYRAAFHAA